MSDWKKQTSRESDKSFRAVFPNLNLKVLDKIYDNTKFDISNEIQKKRSNHISFSKQVSRSSPTSPSVGGYNLSANPKKGDPVEEKKLKELELQSYDSVLKATDLYIAKATNFSNKGDVQFSKSPARERHFLSKYDGPVGMKNTSQIDFYTSHSLSGSVDKLNSIDLKRQSPRKPIKLKESEKLTYFDIDVPKSHVPSTSFNGSKRKEKYSWMQYFDSEGDPGKYLPNDISHSRKGVRPKLIPNFSKDTNRSKVKHLHPRIQMLDLSYNISSDMDKKKGVPNLFLSTGRHADPNTVVRSVDTLLSLIDKDLFQMKLPQN